MADYCVFCDTRRPKDGTLTLVINDGVWLEFCPHCGDREWLKNELTGEEVTVYNLFAQDQAEFPYREPTQSFKEWQGDAQLEQLPAQAQASPEPSHPTFADVWPA